MMNLCTFSSSRQRGITLPIVLILLIPMTLLAVMVAKRNNLEELMAASQRDGQQALMNAESGLELTAVEFQDFVATVIANTNTLTLDEFQAGSDITALGNYTDGADVSFGVVVADYAWPGGSAPAWVTADNQRLVVTSTGAYRGAERVVEAVLDVVTTPDPSGGGNFPDMSIFAEGVIKLNGNPKIYGPDARIHTNAHFDVSGTTKIDGSITQSDSGTNYGSGFKDFSDNQIDVSVVTRLETPYVYPPLYKGIATRYMTRNCDVWDGPPGGDNPLTGNSAVLLKAAEDSGGARDGYNGWVCDATCFGTSSSCKNKKWDLSGSGPEDGFYYVEGNLNISGNPGEDGSPFKISIVTEGYIDVNGNPNITPYYQSEEEVDFTNDFSAAAVAAIDPNLQVQGLFAKDQVLQSWQVLLLAGGDLVIQGNPKLGIDGTSAVLAAHDQFTISGNPTIYGGILSEGATYGDDTEFFDNIDSGEQKADYVTMNEISGESDQHGNVSIDFAGNSPPTGGGNPLGVKMVTWRELVQ